MDNKTNWQDVQVYQCDSTDGVNTATSVGALLTSDDKDANMYATKGLAVALREYRDGGAAKGWCFTNSAHAGSLAVDDIDWSGLDDFLATHNVASDAVPAPGLSGFLGRISS